MPGGPLGFSRLIRVGILHLGSLVQWEASLVPTELVAQLVPEMLPIGLKTLGPGFESLGRRKELSGNEDIL